MKLDPSKLGSMLSAYKGECRAPFLKSTFRTAQKLRFSRAPISQKLRFSGVGLIHEIVQLSK